MIIIAICFLILFLLYISYIVITNNSVNPEKSRCTNCKNYLYIFHGFDNTIKCTARTGSLINPNPHFWDRNRRCKFYEPKTS